MRQLLLILSWLFLYRVKAGDPNTAGQVYNFVPSWFRNGLFANDASFYTYYSIPTTTTTKPTTTTTTTTPPVTTPHHYGCVHDQQATCLPMEHDRYPTPDGTCNNRLNTNKGKSSWPLKRLIKPDYKDGISAPRVARDGSELPTARMVHLVMADQTPVVSADVSHMMPWWGQYIVHDMANTPKIKNPDGTELDCDCDNPHKDCFNIQLGRTDIQRVTEGKKCLPFFRSKATKDVTCNSPHKNHVNSISSYIDSGTVYGNTQEELDSLLDPNSGIGELKIHGYHGHHSRPNLPTTDDLKYPTFGKKIACKPIHKPVNTPCLAAGDVRANENTGLTSLHNAFLRYHNKLVKKLSDLNGHWGKQRLFKEARSIISAVHQIITYRDFLPVVVGPDFMKSFDLELSRDGHTFGYDASYDASVSEAFTTAAFRYGHVMVNKEMSRPSANWHSANAEPIPLKNSLFNNEPLFNESAGGMDSVMRGLTTDHSLVADTTMVDDMANFLFAKKGKFGNDLYSINIQRGRDHGLPGYNSYREWCGLKKAKTFDDLDEVSWKTKQRLRTVYRHVDDIDLFVGGLSEAPVEGGAVGPTFACIIAYQFRDTKVGDRFWHENGGRHQVFNSAQLKSLRKYTFSKFVCETTTSTTSIQPFPMLIVNNHENSRRSCVSFPAIDLAPWKEFKFHQNKPTTEYEFTQWFPNEFSVTCDLLRHLKATRSDDVCGDVSAIETRKIGGMELVRFQCPKGSLTGTDFPNHEYSTNVYWSQWTDKSTPSYNGAETEGGVPTGCENPIAMQAFTVDGVPARQTGDVFSSFSIADGLICNGKHQHRGLCKNYKTRYLCRNEKNQKSTGSSNSRPTPGNSHARWTQWISTENSYKGDDTELLISVQNLPGYCRKPLNIDARSVGTHKSLAQTNDILAVLDKDIGLVCRSSDQGLFKSCANYEVRYLCP